jgi:hypothetical protein
MRRYLPSNPHFIQLIAIFGLILASSSSLSAKVIRTPVGEGSVSGLLQSCLLQGGGDHPNDHSLPVFCCATNEEGTKWCVACYSGTSQNPSDCSVTTPAKSSLRNRLQNPAPTGLVIAPSNSRPTQKPRVPKSPTPTVIAPSN